ncbi:MAG: S41 family peptidase [Bdellovibrionales bacterium]
MRSLLLFLVVTLSSSALAQVLAGDPCQLAGQSAPVVAFGNLPNSGFNENNLLLGLQLSRERRLKVVCELKSAVIQKYALIQLKKERLNIDVDQHMQECARAELQIASGDRQDFYDRVLKCIAGFQDTHFGGYSRVRRPVTLTAIQIIDVGGKIVISRQSPLLIARIKAENEDAWKGLDETLAIGNEVTMIDGLPAADAVAQLTPYISASSPAFASLYASMSFFQRSFQYPTKKTVTLEIRTEKGDLKHIELPWMAQITPGNFDAQAKFKALGLPLVTELQWKYDPVLKKFDKSDEALFPVGFNLRNPLFADKATITTYLDDGGAPGLRTGEVILDRSQVFCYMQLLTFMSQNFTKDGSKDPKDKVKFFDPIRSFVASCEKKKMPLLLDLKLNGGGNGSYPAKLLAILSEKGAKYPSDVAAFAITPSMVDIVTQDINPSVDSGARDLDAGLDTVTMLSAVSDAIQNGAKYTDVLNAKDVTTDATVGGYSQKVVAIVSPICISACDMTARLLKNSKRAVLIGTAANGTGAGFWSSDTKLDSSFSDSEGLLSFEIPNFLFGVETLAGDAQRLPFETGKALLSENLPTQADVIVPFTVDDVRTGGDSISKAAVTELFK